MGKDYILQNKTQANKQTNKKHKGLQLDGLGFESSHCHLLSRSLWESSLASLSLSVLTCKTGIVSGTLSWASFWGLNEITSAKCLAQFLAQGEHSHTYYKS